MRKYKIILFALILFLGFSVKAKNSLELVCNTPKIIKNGYTNCHIMLNYDAPVSNVEFNYESEMDLTFTIEIGGELSYQNNKLVLNYPEAISPNNVKILNLKVTNTNDILGKKKVSLKNIRVTSNGTSYSLDNQEKDISVITEDDLSNNCNLDSLTIDGVSVPNFDPSKYKYSGIIAHKRTIYLDAVRSDELSSATGLGNALLTENVEKDIFVYVTAENGNKCTYTLGITYVKEDTITKSNNNNLDNIELYSNNEIIDYNFDINKNTFDIKVDYNISNIDIKAVLQDEKALFVSKFGPRNVKLEEGKNIVLIKVQAEDESIKTYTLNITRENNISGDTTLKKLIINNVEVILKNNEFDYEITLPDVVTKTDIQAIANDENSKVIYENIDVNDNNVVSIKVEAPNGDVSEYNVTLEKEENSTLENEKFQSLSVSGYHLDFDINKSEYTLKINSDDDQIDVYANPSDIDITVINNTHLKNGSVVTVKVIDGDIERNYQITIEKDASMKTNVICYLFFIVAVIILLISFRYWVKNRKMH